MNNETINATLSNAKEISAEVSIPDKYVGPKGDKGDPFTFEDLTPEQKAELSGDWESLQNKPFTYIDEGTLVVKNGVLKVNTTDTAEQDNTKPITSSGVHVILGDIETILEAI